jgi:hypothetical protein
MEEKELTFDSSMSGYFDRRKQLQFIGVRREKMEPSITSIGRALAFALKTVVLRLY